MNAQLALDWNAAARRRDDGICRAVEHADRESPSWSDLALTFLRGWVQGHRGELLAEDVVLAARGQVPAPPDGRAWGGVLQRAARAGVIAKAGYAPAKTSNLSPKVLWRAR